MLTDPGGGSYHLVVVTTDGKVSRTATGVVPHVGGFFPRFSVAGRSVYFIDGDTHLKVLRPDGSVHPIVELPGDAGDRVVFAVSPDETLIALSVLRYVSPCQAGGQPCTSTSLRVGSLDLHDLHEVFAGPVVEFPIGWHEGRIVMAVAESGFIQNPGEVNPYFASALHLVDPSSANRLFSTSPACDPPSSIQGPSNSMGLLCQQATGNLDFFYAHSWDGSTHEVFRQQPGGVPSMVPPVVLRPDGHSAAGANAVNHEIDVLDSGGIRASTSATGTPAGWFDENHLLFFMGPCCTDLTGPAVLTVGGTASAVTSSAVTPISPGVPGTADPYAPFFVPIPADL